MYQKRENIDINAGNRFLSEDTSSCDLANIELLFYVTNYL